MNDSFPDDRLSARYDAELSPEETELVDQSVAKDPESAALLREFSWISSQLSLLPKQDAPEGFLQSIQEKIASKLLATPVPRRRPSARNWLSIGVPLFAAAAVFLVMLGPPREDLPLHGLGGETPDLLASQFGQDQLENEGFANADLQGLGGGPPSMEMLTQGAPISASEEERGKIPSALSEMEGADKEPNLVSRPSKIEIEDYVSKYLLQTKELRSLSPGDVVKAIQLAGEEIAVVELTVVNVDRSVEDLEILLTDNGVLRDAELTVDGYEKAVSRKSGDLVAIYVEADPQQLQESLASFFKNHKEESNLASVHSIEKEQIMVEFESPQPLEMEKPATNSKTTRMELSKNKPNLERDGPRQARWELSRSQKLAKTIPSQEHSAFLGRIKSGADKSSIRSVVFIFQNPIRLKARN